MGVIDVAVKAITEMNVEINEVHYKKLVKSILNSKSKTTYIIVQDGNHLKRNKVYKEGDKLFFMQDVKVYLDVNEEGEESDEQE